MSYEGWISAVWLFGQPLEVNMVIETSQFIDDVFWSKKMTILFYLPCQTMEGMHNWNAPDSRVSHCFSLYFIGENRLSA